MKNGSLMKVEVLQNAPLGAFCNTFDLHSVIMGLNKQFLVFFLSGRLRQALLYLNMEGFLEKTLKIKYVVKILKN